ncbi:hypothetical protein AGMMS49983_16050 [Clostridia bacterium]|nr:hypothetical protein AGMMS49983_16050 [Clostridia bacterium]
MAFLLYLDRPETIEADPLYVNLADGPVYVRSGFDPADTAITDPESISMWDERLPAGHSSAVIASGVPSSMGGAGRHFLSVQDEADSEYTILIPFAFTSAQFDLLFAETPVVPGIFLSGIGDNWEIFLNGTRVISEVYLGEDGQITHHRSQRDVTFPLDRNLLKAGENVLTFRIIGAHSSSLTGLFYASPYFIGAYSETLARHNNVVTMVFCTIYIFVGLYHLLLFFMRRTDRYNLAYGLFSILVAVYFISRSAAIYFISQDTNITQRIEYGAIYALLFMLVAFVEQLNFGRLLPVSKIYGLFCIALIVLQCIFSEQMCRGFFDFSETVIFFSGIRRILADRGHADDRVERRADLVAHVGEELTFCPGSRLGDLYLLFQFLRALLHRFFQRFIDPRLEIEGTGVFFGEDKGGAHGEDEKTVLRQDDSGMQETRVDQVEDRGRAQDQDRNKNITERRISEIPSGHEAQIGFVPRVPQAIPLCPGPFEEGIDHIINEDVHHHQNAADLPDAEQVFGKLNGKDALQNDQGNTKEAVYF